MNEYRVLYSIQYFGTNNQYPHITNHEQYDHSILGYVCCGMILRSVYLFTYLLTYLLN